ncbi:hypothetical protein AV530_013333 [Patagioenas fasciata monilis]|uniref:Uncharacterized protein n=1 Tax=Patagioenas fasciata monilis TaxID=372326 RepID=A0A1V4JNY9_PATFA|nr:hypothetical protein AV530_013333 [Patagioenas fasciata monilis]
MSAHVDVAGQWYSKTVFIFIIKGSNVLYFSRSDNQKEGRLQAHCPRKDPLKKLSLLHFCRQSALQYPYSFYSLKMCSVEMLCCERWLFIILLGGNCFLELDGAVFS